MNILITGGAGFIGSHLAEAWLEKGIEVAVIDNLFTGKIENITHLEKNEKFNFIKGSITDKETIEKLVKKADIIYHLAAVVGVKLVVKEPIETIETNVEGTSIILNLANKYKKRILIASSSEIYGKNEETPLKESSDRLMGPTYISRWCYACSKAIDEFLALDYHKKYNLPVTIVRFFNTIGPRQTEHYGMVIPQFIKQALSNKPITIYGNGKQTRCFAYVKDVVKCLIALTDKKEAEGEIFNIGSKEEITIKELAERIKEMTNSKSELKYISYKEAFKAEFEDTKKRVPDISKLKNTIGFIPEMKLNEILKTMIDFELNKRLKK